MTGILKSNILSHRGYWKHDNEKNTILAVERAVENGYGLEIDIRDYCGELIISHDIPKANEVFYFDEFLNIIKKYGKPIRTALNIKSDGLQSLLTRALPSLKESNSNFYVFDMSFPETFRFYNTNFSLYTRVSEYENNTEILKMGCGVWVDNFSGDFNQIEISLNFIKQKKRVAFVSPELHGRDHLPFWHILKESGLHKYKNFEICTDYPADCENFFLEKRND